MRTLYTAYLLSFRPRKGSTFTSWIRFYADDVIAQENGTATILREYPHACDIIIVSLGYTN